MSFVRVLLVAIVLASCSSNPGGSGDPCAETPTLSCTDPGPSPDTCDEVYTAQAATDFRPNCDHLGLVESTSHCNFTQCCFNSIGLHGHPSLHCVSSAVDPNYRAYCVSSGGTYCPR